MIFKNREHAARLLAEKLARHAGGKPLVLGIPRGAVPMAKIIAEVLDGDLDVVLVHKLGAPGEPELAIGSIDEGGHVYLTEHAYGVGSDYIEQEKKQQLERLRQRRALYTPMRAPLDPGGRTVIVVDNGIATGATMLAALRAVRQKKPARLIGAVAVAPPSTIARLAREADEIVCLEVPPDFHAVGEFFEEFAQVSDEDVIAILKERASAFSAAG
ncbi:MAG TPA: phosphoribosyltransferase family protein [Candidatus Acidoferrales bacterium]|nr:phosphoribosyltransferase family protein [Candidatus Acidoferrales bacterium]